MPLHSTTIERIGEAADRLRRATDELRQENNELRAQLGIASGSSMPLVSVSSTTNSSTSWTKLRRFVVDALRKRAFSEHLRRSQRVRENEYGRLSVMQRQFGAIVKPLGEINKDE